MSSGPVDLEGITVGRTADLLGVSVRTLHHWDEIGLVEPSGRTPTGYRLYSADDIARLQSVLVYREVGLPLAEIAEILDDAHVDVTDHLRRQKELLESRISRMHELVHAVDSMMERMMTEENTTPEDQARSFGSSWNDPYHEEAEAKYGHTDDWAVSQKRAAQLGPEEWERVKADLEALEADLARAFLSGVEPGSPEAVELAERHRANVGQWMDVTYAKHVLMACNYVQDPRFAAHYDERAAGLAVWLKAVIDANAQANGVDPSTAEWE